MVTTMRAERPVSFHATTTQWSCGGATTSGTIDFIGFKPAIAEPPKYRLASRRICERMASSAPGNRGTGAEGSVGRHGTKIAPARGADTLILIKGGALGDSDVAGGSRIGPRPLRANW
jgi:hypothetical protein